MSSSSQVQWGGIAITSTTNVALLILGLQGVRLMCWITFRCSTVTQQIERKHFYSQLWMETVLLEARFWEFQCDLTGSIFVSAKGLFGVSELNTCCAALTNTNPYTRNRKYYDVVQNLGKGDWGWGGGREACTSQWLWFILLLPYVNGSSIAVLELGMWAFTHCSHGALRGARDPCVTGALLRLCCSFKAMGFLCLSKQTSPLPMSVRKHRVLVSHFLWSLGRGPASSRVWLTEEHRINTCYVEMRCTR